MGDSPLVFEVLGFLSSVVVFCLPLPKFWSIRKRGCIEDSDHAMPYATTLFTCMLLLFYGYLKIYDDDGLMIIIINSIGCILQVIYIILFLNYTTKESQIISTINILARLNVGSFGFIIITIVLTTDDASQRIKVTSWICAVICSVCVVISPINVMRVVMEKRSLENMSIFTSVCFTICVVIKSISSLLINDYFATAPNALGVVMGMMQVAMYFYMSYKGQNEQAVGSVEEEMPGGLQPEDATVNPETILDVKVEAAVALGLK